MLSEGTAIVLIGCVCNSWDLFIVFFFVVPSSKFFDGMQHLSVLLGNKWSTGLQLLRLGGFLEK